ncbi:hypothetical protein ACFPOE_22200 [Caenimonas terrae]|uniref:Uncharacterized protein n=1 Tax=Caenimonas terrae TaxID=696074 RepID=A0ABW0NIM0_9BURK
MELILLGMILGFAGWLAKSRDQGARIALLGSHLGSYQIERHLETLTEGYLRALGEADAGRREQIWSLLRGTEQALASQFERFAAGFAKVDEADARVSTLPIGLPFATRWMPAATFDVRKALAIHARGISRAVAEAGQGTAQAKAFTLMAELFLMQHTCHWYCKSRTVASARLLARHKTSYRQAIDAVGPATRASYCELVGAA